MFFFLYFSFFNFSFFSSSFFKLIRQEMFLDAEGVTLPLETCLSVFSSMVMVLLGL